MITGTFYGNKVRIDAHTRENGTSYYVQVLELDGWTDVAIFSEVADPYARDEAIALAKRLQTKVEAL